jgi:site-specific recombinase XerC
VPDRSSGAQSCAPQGGSSACHSRQRLQCSRPTTCRASADAISGGKPKRTRRPVPVGSTSQQWLSPPSTTIKSECLPEDVRPDRGYSPDPKGRPIRQHNLVRPLGKILDRATLPTMRFNDLRHTAATLMLSAGVHPQVVQERLGHSKIAVTLDTYSHVLSTMQREAARKIDFCWPRRQIACNRIKQARSVGTCCPNARTE